MMKSLKGGLVAWVLITAGCFAEASPVEFNAEERDWIARHPLLRVGIMEDLLPLEYMRAGNLYGQSKLYLNYLTAVTGLKLKYVPFQDMAVSRGALVDGQVDLLSASLEFAAEPRDPALKVLAYHRTPPIIVTRVDSQDIFSLDQLQGKTVMVPDVERYLWLFNGRARHAQLVQGMSALDMLDSVAEGRADVAVAAETYFMPYLYSRFQGVLEISGVVGAEPLAVGMAARAQDTVLISILEKVLNSIDLEQRQSLYAQWYRELKVNVPTLSSVGKHYFHVLVLAALALLGLCILMFRGFYHWRREVKKAREKSMLLRVISQALRSPLNDVLTAMNHLLSTQLNERQRNLVSLANGSMASLRCVLDEDLNVLEAPRSRPEQRPSEPTDVKALMTAVVSLHRIRAQQKNLELELQIPSHLPRLLLDSSRLTQLLHNIISNAIKFTHTGGVYVSARLIESERDVQLLNIEIRDTGEGVPESVSASLFQPYEQARRADQKKGTGLGLVICQQLVKSMDGSMTFVSEPNVGTTVMLSLPTTIPSARREAPASNTPTAASASKTLPRILVVEDSWANQEVLHEQIVSLGCRPTVVGDGVQAKERFNEEHPDLILMDCDLPGQDGYSLTRELRSAELQLNRSRCPIIAISASTGEQHAKRCLAAGMDALLNKPIQLNALRGAIELWCHVRVNMPPSEAVTPAKPSTEALEAMADDLGGLIKAIAICDRPAALHLAHRLYGAALIMKWSTLSEIARNMEVLLGQGRSWDDPGYAISLQTLIQQWQVSSERMPLDALQCVSGPRESLQ